MTAPVDKDDHWEFPDVEMTSLEKRMIVATMVQIGVITMFNTHVYSFNGELFLQKAGGPIGLRSTYAVARVAMNYWDSKWMETMRENNVRIRAGDRYMDDIRAFLNSIKEGWRWHEGHLCWTETWKNEDQKAGESGTRRTSNVLIPSMNSVLSFLNFTSEIHEDFEDNKLPSLDTNIWVEGLTILFEHYGKPMSTNLVVP